ncbi:hypothetical protein D3C83_329790 [compost metagenome]
MVGMAMSASRQAAVVAFRRSAMGNPGTQSSEGSCDTRRSVSPSIAMPKKPSTTLGMAEMNSM